MNRIVATALIAFAASSAFAESPTVDSTPFASTLSRAQVTAEFLQSRAQAAALTAEDSGSAFLSARGKAVAAPVVAGQPANAQ